MNTRVGKQRGTVKWFNAGKGFGFIEPDGGGDDVFIHANQLAKCGCPPLQQGDEVDFEIDLGSGGRKKQAINVQILKKSAS